MNRNFYNLSGYTSKEVLNEQFDLFGNHNLAIGHVPAVQNLLLKLEDAIKNDVIILENGFDYFCSYTASGSLSNDLALYMARQTVREGQFRDWPIAQPDDHRPVPLFIVSNLTHKSILTAIERNGFEALVLDVDPNKNFCVAEETLLKTIAQNKDRLAGLCVTNGTTQLGTKSDFESSDTLPLLKHSLGFWLHLDAAYGATYHPASANSGDYFSANNADSITVDIYKSFGLAGVSQLLTHRNNMPKLVLLDQKNTAHYFSKEYGVMGTTLSAFPAATQLGMLKEIDSLSMAERMHKQAAYIYKKLRDAGIQFLLPPEASMCAFKHDSQKDMDQFAGFCAKEHILISPSIIKGQDYELFSSRVVVTPANIMNDPKLVEDFIHVAQKFQGQRT